MKCTRKHKKGSPFELPFKSSEEPIDYAKSTIRSSRFKTASSPCGFFGLSPSLGASRGGGLPLPGTTTGGGGFFGGSPFCAIAATDKPVISKSVNKKYFNTFITS